MDDSAYSLTAEQLQHGFITVATSSRHTGALKWVDGVLMQEFENVEYQGGSPISASREWTAVPTETKDTTK